MRIELKGKRSNLILNRETRIPAVPAIIYNTLNLVRDDATSSQDPARVIRRDQSISVRLLKLAYSAYYGCSRQIGTLYRAIMVLGFNEVSPSAIGMGLFPTVQRDEQIGLLTINALCTHSIGAPMASEEMPKKRKAQAPASLGSHRELPVLRISKSLLLALD